MGGMCSFSSKVTWVCYDSQAKLELPNPIGDHPWSEWVVVACDPICKCKTSLLFWCVVGQVKAVECCEGVRDHLFTFCVGFSAIKSVGGARLGKTTRVDTLSLLECCQTLVRAAEGGGPGLPLLGLPCRSCRCSFLLLCLLAMLS